MKHNIAIIDSAGKTYDALLSIKKELDSEIYIFNSPKDLAGTLNSNKALSDELGLFIICMPNRTQENPGFNACINFSKQLKNHSRLSSIPLLLIGPDNYHVKESCRSLCMKYISTPVKKKDLFDTVKALTRDKDNNRSVVSSINKHHDTISNDPDNLNYYPPAAEKSISVKDSERRIATVMFADISGFTAMSEKMDPEEVTRIMNLCFKTLGSCIKNHGGYIDKFIGDCIMAVFGAPEALENAPLCAINTAINIRNTLYKFNGSNNLATPLDIHIGINTGIVLSGTVGSEEKMEYTVMGDTVNLASRLENASERGQILVGLETFKAAKNRFSFKQLKPITLKGKTEPVPAYEVLSDREASIERVIKNRCADNATSERIIFSELVGRNDEINKLRLIIMKLINGEGGIVNIIGEAGIGKSRLITELTGDTFINQVTLLEGRTITIGKNLSYYPIIDLIKKWSGITEDDTQQNALNKLDKSIRKIYPESANEIIPFIATLMKLNLTGNFAERVKGIEGEPLENLIRKNIRELLKKSSEIRPLIICIEDLHWADTSSIELLESLFNLAEKNRILFINVFRPGYVDTGDRVTSILKIEFPGIYSEIRLEPLTEDDSAKLASNLLNIKGLPYKLENEIRERSGGNPFFIEEVIRSLIDDGAVILKNSIFTVTEKINNIIIPMTINELLMSRIDRLDEDTRNLVKTASVIGRAFFYKIISKVAQNTSEIDLKLNYLEDIQLIRERKRLDEVEFLFKHVLTQEAAYESLLIKKRKEIHLQVADAIENVFSERLHEFYGMLAYHYSMGENFPKAENFMYKAGEAAMKSSASNEAITYYKEALNLYLKQYGDKADPAKITNMYKNIANALYNCGLYWDAGEYYNRALEYYGYKEKNKFMEYINSLIGIMNYIIAIKYPLLKWQKIPDDFIKEKFILAVAKCQALSTSDPKKFFLQTSEMLKWGVDYKISEFENGIGVIPQMSIAFTWPGISCYLSRKSLSYADKIIDSNSGKSYLIFKYAQLQHNAEWGFWDEIYFDNELFNSFINYGELLFANIYLAWLIHVYTAKGLKDKSFKLLNIYTKMGSDYNHGISIGMRYYCEVEYLYKFRELEHCMTEADEGILYCEKISFFAGGFVIQALKAQAYILSGEMNEAELILEKIGHSKNEVYSIPFYYSFYLFGRALYETIMLENKIMTGDKSINKVKAYKLCKEMARLSTKVMVYRTESLCLMGTYFWISGKYKKALKWWNKSITEGTNLGANLELSRTYFEIGKRLNEMVNNSKSNIPERKITDSYAYKIIGLSANQCLDKAESMFQEIGLTWDIEQLELFKNNK